MLTGTALFGSTAAGFRWRMYTAADLSKGVRGRIWAVLSDWHHTTGATGSVIMLWRDAGEPGGLGVLTLGTPPGRLADLDGVLVSVR